VHANFPPHSIVMVTPARLAESSTPAPPKLQDYAVSVLQLDAADLLDAKLIREMESGQRLSLGVVDTNILTLTTSLPLN